MSASTLAGRVAVVLGASGVVGSATVAALASRGASVAVHYSTNREAAERAIAGLTVPHLLVQANLQQPDALAEVRAHITAHLGATEILVNTVHFTGRGPSPVAAASTVDLERELASVSLHQRACAAFVPAMRDRGRGRVVYVSGALANRPAAGMGLYAAAKAAGNALTRHVALEEGRFGVTANIVALGRIVADGAPDDPAMQELATRLRERLALPDFPRPDEAAEVIAALCEDPFRAVTGQTLWVTGGEPIGP